MRAFTASLVLRFVDRLSQPVRGAARAIGNVASAQRMAQRASQQWSRGLDDLDDRLNRLAQFSLVTDGLDRAGQAVMRPLRAAVAGASEFDQRMTGIGITAELTDAQLVPLRQTILGTASALGALPGDVQGVFGAVLAEGAYRTRRELELAGTALSRFQRLAGAMGETLSDDEAGALSGAFGTAYRLAAEDIERSTAMMNRSAKQGGVSLGVLARNLPAQSGALRGLSFANDVGLADLLTANQVAKRLAGTSDQAANNVTNLLASLASPETIRRFSEAGVNLEAEIRAGVERGISPFETLAATTQRITGGDQFRIGELFGDRQARDGIMALVQNLDDFRSMSAELREDNTLAQYLADIDRATSGSAASFARYQSGIGRLGVAVGTILAPAVSWAADRLEKVATWMSRASESGNPLARAAVWVAAGFAAAAVAAGAIGHAVVGVLGPLLIMRAVFGTLGRAAVVGMFARLAVALNVARTAMLGFNLAMLANPVGLAVAGIVLAITAIALVVRKYWQPIAAFFTGVGQAVGEALAPLGVMLAPLAPIWNAVTGAVRAFFGWIGRLLRPVQLTADQMEGATSAGRRFGQMIVTAFSWSPIGLFVRAVQLGFTLIRALLAWNPMPTLRAAWSGIGGFFSSLPARFAGFGRAIIQGLINGIRSMLGGVRDAVMNTASSAVNWFRNRLGIRSPSRVFAALGDDTMAGLAVGLTRSATRPLGSLTALSAAMAAHTLATPALAVPAAPVMVIETSAGPRDEGDDPTLPPRPPSPPPSAAAYRDLNLTQHFHLDGSPDVRQLARELARLSRQGLRSALNDAVNE